MSLESSIEKLAEAVAQLATAVKEDRIPAGGTVPASTQGKPAAKPSNKGEAKPQKAAKKAAKEPAEEPFTEKEPSFEEVVDHLKRVGKEHGRKGIEEILSEHDAPTADKLDAEQYASVIEAAKAKLNE